MFRGRHSAPARRDRRPSEMARSSRGYGVLNGHGATRSRGISSPCCGRRIRATLGACHAILGSVICLAAGVLPTHWNTYLGHLGPAAVMYIFSELERYPGASRRVDARVAEARGAASNRIPGRLVRE